LRSLFQHASWCASIMKNTTAHGRSGLSNRSFMALGIRMFVLFTMLVSHGFSFAAPTGTAELKFSEGQQAFAAGKYQAALESFQASMDIEASPMTRFKIAMCYYAMHKLASAHTQFERVSREASDRFKLTKDRRLLTIHEQAQTQSALIKPMVPHLSLIFSSKPPSDTKIRIDDSDLHPGTWNNQLPMDPGKHNVVAEGPRIRRLERSVEIGFGEHKRLEIVLDQIATATVRLVFPSKPAGLAVSIDDQQIGPERILENHVVEANRRIKVTVTAPGFLTYTWQKILSTNEQRNIHIDLDPVTGTPRWAFFFTSSAAIALGAVSTGLVVHAQNLADDEIQRVGGSPYDRNLYLRVQKLAIAGDVGFGLAGVLGVTATVLAFTTRWKTERGESRDGSLAWQLLPFYQNRTAGLSVTGAF
jgi:hypothetical protein